jgi:hypothetical protein
MGTDVLPSNGRSDVVAPTWVRSRRVAFYGVISLLMVSLGVVFWRVNLFWLLAWLPKDVLERLYASQLEFDMVPGPFAPHIVHYLALSASQVMVLLGLAVQLRRPWTKVAPIWQAAGSLFLSVITLPFALVSVGPSQIPPPVLAVIALVIAAALLHPGNPLRNPPRPVDRLMSGLWAIAAIPAVLLTVSQIQLELRGSPADPHWLGLHYNFMAEFGLHVVLVGLLGASALSGWRLSAWSVSFMVALLGIGFVAYPNLSGSYGPTWGVAMIGWAVLFIATAEVRNRRRQLPPSLTAHPRSRRPDDRGRRPIEGNVRQTSPGRTTQRADIVRRIRAELQLKEP